MIKLYGTSRSRSSRPLWMLEELGVEYEHVPVEFMGGATREPEFLAMNPNGHIPVLVDGDLTLWESMAINLYLARKYDGGLQPTSLEDEARAVQWSFWVMTETELSAIDLLFNRVILPEEDRDPEVATAAAEALVAPFEALEGALEGREFLVGDRFSVADLNVAAVLRWCQVGGFDFSDTPNVDRWLDASISRPAVKRAQGAP